VWYARDCPKHPYKPRVYTLGIAEDTDALEDLPKEMGEFPEEQIEMDRLDHEVVPENDDD